MMISPTIFLNMMFLGIGVLTGAYLTYFIG